MGLMSMMDIIIAVACIAAGVLLVVPVLVYSCKHSTDEDASKITLGDATAEYADVKSTEIDKETKPKVKNDKLFELLKKVYVPPVGLAVKTDESTDENALSNDETETDNAEDSALDEATVDTDSVTAEPVVDVQIAEPIEDIPVAVVVEPILAAEPIIEEVKPVAPVEKPAPEPVAEIIKPEPVAETKPEPVAEPIKEPVAPAPPKKKPVKPAPKAKIVVKKEDDWTHYEGDYEGYYYDPEDACYYEGEAPADIATKLDAKRKEIEEAEKSTGKKIIIKKIAPPFATLKTPKHDRQIPKAVDGFDEAVIYGKYVIEHVGEEYFYTLYNNKEIPIYLSGNYANLNYCERAIKRFKTHVLVGVFTIEEKAGKFNFVLTRKTYSHRGAFHSSRAAAERHAEEVRKFAATDIMREQ